MELNDNTVQAIKAEEINTNNQSYSNSTNLNQNKNEMKRKMRMEISSTQLNTKQLTGKSQLDIETLIQSSGWTQCCFFVKSKNRLCNLTRSKDSLYCGVHASTSDQVALNNDKSSRILRKAQENGFESIERVPCPIDPSHSIYKHNIKAHVKICCAHIRNVMIESQVFYSKDINSGSNLYSNGESIVEDIEAMKASINPEMLLEKVRKCYNFILNKEKGFENINNESIDYSDKLNTKMEELVHGHVSKNQSTFEKLRHVKQDARIVANMISQGIVGDEIKQQLEGDNNTVDVSKTSRFTFVELGAGKGLLGQSISVVFPNSKIIFIERGGNRKKADKSLRENSIEYSRIRTDIRHCDFSKLPGIDRDIQDKHKRIVFIAKHLCGVATDLSLKGLDSLGDNKMDVIKGITIATCCHHACVWKDYVGYKFYLSQGFVPEEFDILKTWSAWAHTLDNCSLNSRKRKTNEENLNDEDALEHMEVIDNNKNIRPEGLNNEEMSIIGNYYIKIIKLYYKLIL